MDSLLARGTRPRAEHRAACYTRGVNGPTRPPPPPLPPAAGPPPAAPVELEAGRPGLVLLVGVVVTAIVCGGLVALWPNDDDTVRSESTADAFAAFVTTVPGATGEPSDNPTGGDVKPPSGSHTGPSLFDGGASIAVAEVIEAAGGPSQFMEIVLYPTYAFVAYRDPVATDHIDERQWRDGTVDEARPNPIDDRVNADVAPSLFTAEEVDLSMVPGLIADAAANRYDVPVMITHVIIERFLPFDTRVLVRVYASPADGRSGGGYVTYDRGGNLVRVCC